DIIRQKLPLTVYWRKSCFQCIIIDYAIVARHDSMNFPWELFYCFSTPGIGSPFPKNIHQVMNDMASHDLKAQRFLVCIDILASKLFASLDKARRFTNRIGD